MRILVSACDSNSEDSIDNLEYHAGIGLSDHLVISILIVKIKLPEEMYSMSLFNYNKGDYEAINGNLIGIDWLFKFLGLITEEI